MSNHVPDPVTNKEPLKLEQQDKHIDDESVVIRSAPQQQQQQHHPNPPAHIIPVHLTRRPTQGPIQVPVDYASLACGLSAGVLQAGIFNPYDRALYLSSIHHRSFFDARNWERPYTGLLQSLSSRAVSGGLYFPVEHYCLRYMDPYESTPVHNFVAGTAAGAVNACLLNPLSAIKYKTWGMRSSTTSTSTTTTTSSRLRRQDSGMWRTATSMWRKSSGSMRPFWNGLVPTLYRDVVFGGCYTWLRLQMQIWFDLQPYQQWKGNLVAAALATVVSGPFNYARNIQYSVSSAEPAAGTWRVLHELMEQTLALPGGRLAQWHFIQGRLRIGWGTARVACGMAFGHAVYDWLHEHVHHYF